jgi:hypothetical protein
MKIQGLERVCEKPLSLGFIVGNLILTMNLNKIR